MHNIFSYYSYRVVESYTKKKLIFHRNTFETVQNKYLFILCDIWILLISTKKKARWRKSLYEVKHTRHVIALLHENSREQTTEFFKTIFTN